MKKIFYVGLLTSILFYSCQQNSNNSNEESDSTEAVTETTPSTGLTLEKIWETDTLERLESIMAEFPHIHTDIMPVKQAPQVA